MLAMVLTGLEGKGDSPRERTEYESPAVMLAKRLDTSAGLSVRVSTGSVIIDTGVAVTVTVTIMTLSVLLSRTDEAAVGETLDTSETGVLEKADGAVGRTLVRLLGSVELQSPSAEVEPLPLLSDVSPP